MSWITVFAKEEKEFLGLFLIFSVLDGGLGLPQLQLYHKLANENCQNFQKQTCGS